MLFKLTNACSIKALDASQTLYSGKKVGVECQIKSEVRQRSKAGS